MAQILVVDDELDVRTMVQVALETAGHTVVTASGGAKALARLKLLAFDAVVLDIMMPEMTGYEVLDGIRTMPGREHTPVIVITAKHDPRGVAREVALGADDHLAKPFLPSELESAIERALTGEDAGERRRILSVDAEVYGSLHALVEHARVALR